MFSSVSSYILRLPDVSLVDNVSYYCFMMFPTLSSCCYIYLLRSFIGCLSERERDFFLSCGLQLVILEGDS